MIKQHPNKLPFHPSKPPISIPIPIRRRLTTGPSLCPPPSKAAKLTNRRLISIHGADSAQFLQGLTTNTIDPRSTRGYYSAFLTAQGRVLNDVFIYPSTHSPAWTSRLPPSFDRADPAYLIEVDADQAEKLVTHVKRYKLRSRIAVRLLDEGEAAVWSLWGGPRHVRAGRTRKEKNTENNDNNNEEEIGCDDTRAPGMGRRVVIVGPSGDSEPQPQPQPHQAVEVPGEEARQRCTLQEYTVRRMLKGVAEGQKEIVREIALPHESNLDVMGAVDFRKGCYVGQELTIRTQHTGVVRKRILPVRLYGWYEEPPAELAYELRTERVLALKRPPAGTSVCRVGSNKKRELGRWLDGVGNVGLALCRLESMVGSVDTAAAAAAAAAAAGSREGLRDAWDEQLLGEEPLLGEEQIPGGEQLSAEAQILGEEQILGEKQILGEEPLLGEEQLLAEAQEVKRHEPEFFSQWVTASWKLDGRVKMKAFVPTWLGIVSNRVKS
ncbi:MAG: ccr4 associated factor [Peltula sp. TS41687]|nr:MAG: ccr4 associated factor [Peltula sp. TS41687]